MHLDDLIRFSERQTTFFFFFKVPFLPNLFIPNQPLQSHVCPRCRCRGVIALSPSHNQQVQVVYGLLFMDPAIQPIVRLEMCKKML